LVDVPIRVVIPAKIDTKLSGIMRRDVDAPMRAAIADMIGRNMMTTGVLFVKAEVAKTAIKVRINVIIGRLSYELTSAFVGPSSAPVWNRP